MDPTPAPAVPPLLPPERAFLLGALFHGALDVPRLRQLASGPLDWASLAATAGACHLGALLFDSIHAAGVASAVPPEVLAGLRAEAARVATRNATLWRAAVRAGDLLAGAGIGAVALKGTALAVHAPRYFAVRIQSDVDLLVERDQARRAAGVLLGGGFQPAATYAGLLGLDGQAPFDEAAPLPPGHHLPPLTSPEDATLELHFEPPARLPPGARQAVRTEVVPGPGGATTHALDAALGMLCAHVLVHHEREPSFLLRHVADVVVLLQAGASAERAGRIFGPTVQASLRLVERARSAATEPGHRHPGPAEAALADGPWRADDQLAT